MCGTAVLLSWLPRVFGAWLPAVASVPSGGGAQLRDAGITDRASVVAFSTTEQPELFEGGWYRDSYVGPAFSERLRRRYSSERLATHTVLATDAVGCAEGLSRTALMLDR